MTQEHDVARVAAALNTPGLRYRSFRNEPVRVKPVPEAEVPQPPTAMPSELPDPAQPAAEDVILLDLPESLPPPLLVTLGAMPEAVPAPAPEPPAAPVAAAPPPPPAETPPPAAMPAPAPAPLPESSFSALMKAGEAALGLPVALPEPPPQPAPAPAPAAVAAAPPPPPSFALLDAVGAAPLPARPAPPSPVSTLARLRGEERGGDTPAREILPASRVTVPLPEVMRLISAGAPAPASPFDAVRASLRPAPASR